MRSSLPGSVVASLLVTLAFVPGLAADSKSAAAAKSGGRLQIQKDVVDVGDVDRGQEANATFVLKNVGSGTLTVLSAKPSCGCTVASFDKTIAPGKEGKVQATIKTGNFRGAIEKSITVTTDDASSAPQELRVKANVLGSATLLPRPGLAFPAGLTWDYSGSVIVRKDETEKGTLKVADLKTSVPWLVAKARRVEGAEPAARDLPAALPGDWIIDVQVADNADSKAAPGQHVRFTTGLPREPEVTIPVSVVFQTAMRATPTPLLLPLPTGEAKQSDGMVTTIVRPGLGKEKLEVTAAPSAFGVKLEPDGPRKYKATVTWKAGADAPKDGTVTFRVGKDSLAVPVHVGDARALFEAAQAPAKGSFR